MDQMFLPEIEQHAGSGPGQRRSRSCAAPLFKLYNAWIDATGVHDMPAEAYAMSGKRMAAQGYAR